MIAGNILQVRYYFHVWGRVVLHLFLSGIETGKLRESTMYGIMKNSLDGKD